MGALADSEGEADPIPSAELALASRWLELERDFADARYEGSGGDAAGLVTRAARSSSPVIVSAGHATNHVRCDAPKLADRGTGGLALLLAEVTGCAAVAALSRCGGDANADEDHPLKEWIARSSRPGSVLVDLHGFASSYEIDVDLGLGPGRHPDGVAELFRTSMPGLVVTENAVFDATRPGTVTAWAQGRGIPAVQAEISARLRPPRASAPDLVRLAVGMIGVVQRLSGPERA